MTDKIAELTKSPLDKAIQARNLAGRNPVPNAAMKQNAEARRIATVPLDYVPGAIRGESTGAEAAGRTLETLHNAWATIAEAAASEASMADVARVGTQALSRALAATDNTLSLLGAREEDLEKRITEYIKPKISDQLATEVRALARETSPAEVRQAGQADARVASAILDMPPLLSGMTSKDVAAFRNAMIKAHAPEVDDELQETRRARVHLETARDRAMDELGPKLRLMKEKKPDALVKLEELA